MGRSPHGGVATLRDHTGFGFSFDSLNQALIRSFFELGERVWSTPLPGMKLRKGCFADAGPKAVSPNLFSPLSEEELSTVAGFAVFDSQKDLHWLDAFEITSSSQRLIPRLLPAILVISGFGQFSPSDRILPMISTGLAAGIKGIDCVLRGAYEIIERDAFAIAWLTKARPPAIGIKSLPDWISRTSKQLSTSGLRVRFMQLPTDFSTTCVYCIITPGDTPSFIAPGLGAHLCPGIAVKKAFAEAMMHLSNSVDLKTMQLRADKHHIPAEAFSRWFTESTEEINLAASYGATAQQAFSTLLSDIQRLNKRLFIVDLTPNDKRLSSGFTLFRTLITEMQPLLYETDSWRLNFNRINQMSQPTSFETFNSLPNPFIVV